MNTSIPAPVSLRPLTASVSEACLDLVRCARPIHAAEHLIQGWDALAAAATKPEKRAECLAFARNRAADAVSALAWEKRATKAKKARTEAANLLAAIVDFETTLAAVTAAL